MCAWYRIVNLSRCQKILIIAPVVVKVVADGRARTLGRRTESVNHLAERHGCQTTAAASETDSHFIQSQSSETVRRRAAGRQTGKQKKRTPPQTQPLPATTQDVAKRAYIIIIVSNKFSARFVLR